MLLQEAVSRRRTFAIISHPDAGKTTLTEKLLLYGGAIQLAGQVKARGERRRTRSDWMKVEAERGISVTSSVMTFEYRDCTFNLLDTPGHEDFSEDTYRTLTAVDSVVMVIDVAKGIESQTRKLFEVCRLRDMPIITFVNKLDRDGREPLEILDEIEQSLQIEVTPASWPIGMGRSFHGCYELRRDRLMLLDRGEKERKSSAVICSGLDDPRLASLLSDQELGHLQEELEMARELCPTFDEKTYLEGNQTAVFFGSALHNFGVQELLDALVELAPPPRAQPTKNRVIEPTEEKLTGFVFKIQANMDPNHRDRLAFFRIASGRYERGMKVVHPRTKKTMALNNPVLFMAQDRELAEEAFAGDIMGIPNRGHLRIGDALTQGEDLVFTGIPSFAPEILQSVRTSDPLKSKHLGKALMQLAEEGAAQCMRPIIGSDWIVGVAGALQFEVLADRIRTEYNVEVQFAATGMQRARWVHCEDPKELKRFLNRKESSIALDHQGDPVFLASTDWQVQFAEEDWPKIVFTKTKEHA